MVNRILYSESNTDGTVGGSYYSLYYLSRGLDRKRFGALVIFYHDNPLVPVYMESGIDTRVWNLPQPFKLPEKAPKLLRPLKSVINLNRFLLARALMYARFLWQEKVSLVHLNNSVTRNHAWMLAARLYGVPCITHQRGINSHYSKLDRRIGGKLDAVICISEAVKRNLVENGFDPEHLYVIYNGLDPEQVQVREARETVCRKLGISEERPVIGVLGNIKEWKGQEVAIRAVMRLREQHPDLICLLVGDTAEGDQYYALRLKSMIQANGMENSIYFTGYQSNVADWLNLMTLVVHTSIQPEPFGRIFLEAMAMRKPVIGSDAGAVPEIVKHGVTGLLYPPGDDQGLANAVNQLLKDPDTRHAMGSAGYKRLCQRFHIMNNIENTQKLYLDMLT